MKARTFSILLAAAALCWALPSFAQAPRKDVVWARSTAGAPITLDGVLDEPAWALADSVIIRWGVDNGIPGSGYKAEAGQLPTDPTLATIKFLTVGNELYMGAVVRDSSVGGGPDFNRFDGFLIMIMDHLSLNRPTPPLEYTYSWWYDNCLTCDPTAGAPGKAPAFAGKWANRPPGSLRTPTQIANWDAVTRVHGLSNSDAAPDTGYTVEMRFDLPADGYNITQPSGDVVEFSMSVYDCDWFWPINPYRFATNRTWWQNPWDNTSWYGEGKVYARPDVTIHSGTAPTVGPDLRIPNVGNYPPPVIDGTLNDPVWAVAPHFDIRYGDDALRATYPGVGKFRSGQYQAPVNGGMAYIADPADATVRYCFKDDSLYLGFDVRDQVVQYDPSFGFDRWDGFLVSIDDRGVIGPDQQLTGRRLSFQVGPDGTALAHDYLVYLRDVLNGARVALALKPGSTVDTLGRTPDVGYTAELAIDLTKLGYPHGLGDHTLFMGICLLDGDSFQDGADAYAMRAWWFREYEGDNCPAWIYLDPGLFVAGVPSPPGAGRGELQLLGNAPNPFLDRTTIRYALDRSSRVTLEVFDLQGRSVARQALGVQAAGERQAVFTRVGMKSGLYFYRLAIADPGSAAGRATLSGRMMLLQ